MSIKPNSARVCTPEDELLAMQTVYETLSVLPKGTSARILATVKVWLFGDAETDRLFVQRRQALIARLGKRDLTPEGREKILEQARAMGLTVKDGRIS